MFSVNNIKKNEVLKKEINLKEFKKRTALESDCSQLIDYDCKVYHKGKPIILYYTLPDEDLKSVLLACKTIKYQESNRSSGLISTSRIFGYFPRDPMKRNFCSTTSLAKEFPSQHKYFCDFASYLAELYKQEFPDVYKDHLEITTSKILPEWIIPNSPFTSGIVNKDNPLKYHFDTGNFNNVFSNMVCFKQGIRGGHLSCPEYNIKFEIKNNTVIFFDGQKILHGVTPIVKVHPNGYRYTIVYYALKNMWHCKPINEEIARIRQKRTEQEINKLKGLGDL